MADAPTHTAAATSFWARFPKAAPDGLVAAVLLAFLATAGLFYVNIMAAIVDGLVEGLGFDVTRAGYVGTANTAGAAVGALLVIGLVKRFAWRSLALPALFALIAIDLFSIFLRSADVMIGLRFVHGVIGGGLVGTAFAVIARTANPDRSFGMLLFVQFGLGGLGVMFLPQLVPVYGSQVLFLALAAFSITTLLMTPFLDTYPADRKKPRQAMDQGIDWRPLGLTLLAIFLFQAANMGLLAYIIRLGLSFGLERGYVSTALGLATWVALIGPVFVMVMGTKLGRFWPLLAAMALTLCGTAVFHFSAWPPAYLIANCGTGITWGFVIAYLLGMSAEFDTAGRTAALGGFISKMGLATGPFVAGRFIVTGEAYGLLVSVAIAILFLSALIMLIPARVLDRKQAS